MDAALRAIGNSPFLKGQNDRGWTADLDWFLKPDSLHILEGKYANGNGSNGHGHKQSGGPRPMTAAERNAEEQRLQALEDAKYGTGVFPQ